MTIWMLGLGCCLLHATADENATGLCVMTYNIHHGEGRDGKLDLDRIAAVIREANPDIVCLQEMDRNLPRTNHLDFPAELSKRLGMQAVFDCNYAFDGGEYGNATLTRFDVLSHENIRLPNPNNTEPRGCLKTVLRTKAGVVQVLNAHLGLKPGERKQQAEALVQRIENAPTILAGDFNEGVTKPGVALLLTRFNDALAEYTGKRIDHVFVSHAFDILSSRVISTPETAVASDHLPYVAEMRLRAKNDPADKQEIYDTDDEQIKDALTEEK